jgi:hypothetical protein
MKRSASLNPLISPPPDLPGNVERHHSIERAYEADYIESITKHIEMQISTPYRSFNSIGRTVLPNAAPLSTRVVIGFTNCDRLGSFLPTAYDGAIRAPNVATRRPTKRQRRGFQRSGRARSIGTAVPLFRIRRDLSNAGGDHRVCRMHDEGLAPLVRHKPHSARRVRPACRTAVSSTARTSSRGLEPSLSACQSCQRQGCFPRAAQAPL